MLNFPLQLIPEKDKNEEWHKAHIDAFAQGVGITNSRYLLSKSEEYKNFNTYNAVFDPAKKSYMTSPNGKLSPVEYIVWPLARQKVRQLVSEFLSRPMKKKVSTINKEAENRKEKHELDLALSKALEDSNKELSQMLGFDVESEDEKNQMEIPADIEKFMSMTYREAAEDSLQTGIDYLLYAKKLIESFKYGFIDAMITYKSFFKVSIVDGNPYWRRIDPRNCYYDAPYESEFLDDCMWFVEERYLTVNQITAEFKLKNEQIISLQDNASNGNYSSWFDYKDVDGFKIRVVSMEWKSQMQAKVKVSPNKYDSEKPFYKKVKDDYKPRKGETTQSRVVDDIRKCTVIGGSIVTDFGRVENQIRSVDSPQKSSLSYIGLVGDSTTDIQHSLVKELEYLQEFASDILYVIKKTSRKLGKRALVYDTAQIPKQFKKSDNPLQTVLHHMGEDSIVAINSKDESNRGRQHAFNQFKEVNLSPQGDVTELVNLFNMIEDLASKVSGVSPQREGQTEQYETGTNNRSAIIASTRRTEVYMKPYDKVIQRVLERATNLMKIAWKNGKKARFFMSDGNIAVLNALPDISLNDYAFYLNDGGKDIELKSKIDSAAANYLQGTQDPTMILEMIKVFKQDTADEATQILESGLNKMAQMQKEESELQRQSEENIAQINADNDEQEREIKREEIKSKIDVAKINAGARVDVAEIFSDDDRATTSAKEKTKAYTENMKVESQKASQAKSNAESAVKR